MCLVTFMKVAAMFRVMLVETLLYAIIGTSYVYCQGVVDVYCIWFKLMPACSATKEMTTSLNEPMRPTLDEALEYVIGDELVEVSLADLPRSS